jgi:hypothetical protein
VDVVPFIEGYSFIIANSVTPKAKISTLGTYQNKRLVVIRLALEILIQELNLPEKVKIKNLAEL